MRQVVRHGSLVHPAGIAHIAEVRAVAELVAHVGVVRGAPEAGELAVEESLPGDFGTGDEPFVVLEVVREAVTPVLDLGSLRRVAKQELEAGQPFVGREPMRLLGHDVAGDRACVRAMLVHQSRELPRLVVA